MPTTLTDNELIILIYSCPLSADWNTKDVREGKHDAEFRAWLGAQEDFRAGTLPDAVAANLHKEDVDNAG